MFDNISKNCDNYPFGKFQGEYYSRKQRESESAREEILREYLKITNSPLSFSLNDKN